MVYDVTDPAEKDIVILYTNDVHNAYQGGVIGALSKGSYLIDIMNQTGYSIAVPGNHEFDFGMDRFLDLADKADFNYVSCNFIDLKTGEPVFDSYEMKSYGDVDVAYIGITTPESFTKSTPTYFQDGNGNYIYGFCEENDGQDLYDQVQKTIEEAEAAGADYVIALGHAGTDPASMPWTSKEIIANTTGLDVFVDGHSHSTIPSESCLDKAGNTVVLTSAGTKREALGKMVIKADGTKLYFYYFDELQGKFVEMSDNIVVTNGTVAVHLTHCSDYVLTEKEIQESIVTSALQTVETGDEAPFTVTLFFLMFAGAMFGCAYYMKKKVTIHR